MQSKIQRKIAILIFAVVMAGVQFASAQQEHSQPTGVDSQILMLSPGPSQYSTVQSSAIVGHKQVSFSAYLEYYQKTLGLVSISTTGQEDKSWVVKDAFVVDFLWAFGIGDSFQLGLVLPIVMNQTGEGAVSLVSENDPEINQYRLSGAAIKDIRVHAKTRFWDSAGRLPDQLNWGLALDFAMTLPTGDELQFAGENSVVFVPNIIFDLSRNQTSAALNAGFRMRHENGEIAGATVGHQGTIGIGLTQALAKERFLISAEATAVYDMHHFESWGFEYRGALGIVPVSDKTLTLWVSGGGGLTFNDLIGTPKVRILLGLSYNPTVQ